MIGDPNQLPPIGRGRVFADTMEWLNVEYPSNVGTLTDNIRQLVNRVEGNGRGILDLTDVFIQEHHQISDGTEAAKLKASQEELFSKILEYGNGDVDKDLGVYFWTEQEELESLLTDVMVQDMQEYTDFDMLSGDVSFDKLWQQMIRDENGDSNTEVVQVISPYRGEYYGTDAINLLMQKTFNSHWSKKQLDGIGYFDKVIQFKNRPQSDPAYAYNDSTRRNEKAFDTIMVRILAGMKTENISRSKRFLIIWSWHMQSVSINRRVLNLITCILLFPAGRVICFRWNCYILQSLVRRKK